MMRPMASPSENRAGQPAQPQDLVDVARLVTAYYTGTPTPPTPTSGWPSAPRATAARP